MEIAVIGAGMAGLSAALTLLTRGHNVTIFEAEDEAGGRCRTHLWKGEWRVRGALAFVTGETNLIDQARALGIYESEMIEDRSEGHVFSILRSGRTHQLKSLAPAHLAITSLLTTVEKAKLLTALPKLIAARGNEFSAQDTVTACDHFRRSSPAFADYVLEPVWGLFCGFAEQDYSLAWLAWLMSRYDTNSNSWWTYRDGGVGKLTRAMQSQLETDARASIRLGVSVRSVKENHDGVSVVLAQPESEEMAFDGAVVAVPGPTAAKIVTDHPPARRRLFEQVAYAHHDIIFAYFDTTVTPKCDLVVLPKCEGFHCAANLEFAATDDGQLYVYGETKGDRGGLGPAPTDEALLRRFIDDVRHFDPRLASAPLADAYVQRNDMALPTFRPGYLRALNDFRKETGQQRLAFAGDYLLNTSVGSAHLTGLQAAQQLDARLRATS